MWKKRDIFYTAIAIIATMLCWGIIRLLFPILDYYPPESLTQILERSWFVTVGARKPAMFVYATLALVLMALFFKAVQEKWPGRGSMKGLAFGSSLGIIWVFGFLFGWAFLGTTLRAELLNGIVDLIPMAIAGWLIGLAVGRDIPRTKHRIWRPWLAVFLVALGLVFFHILGVNLLADRVGSVADLLFIPETPLQVLLIIGLGIWVGWMFVMIRPGLPFNKAWAMTAFFAFGIFGHSWTWFHLFIPVIDFAGILHMSLFVGLIDAVGVFAGTIVYEVIATT